MEAATGRTYIVGITNCNGKKIVRPSTKQLSTENTPRESYQAWMTVVSSHSLPTGLGRREWIKKGQKGSKDHIQKIQSLSQADTVPQSTEGQQR